MTERRRQVLLLLQQFNQRRRTDSVLLLWYQTVWVSPLKMNRGDCFWVSPPTPEYYRSIWEPGATHLISNLFSSICDLEILPLPRCWHSPKSLVTFAPRLKCQRLRSLPTRNLICLFVVKLPVLWKENQIKAHSFHVLTEFLHSATVINHPNGTCSCYAVTTAYVCVCIFMNGMSWVKINLRRVFMGRSPANGMLEPHLKTSKSLQATGLGTCFVGTSTLIQMRRCVIRKVLLGKPTDGRLGEGRRRWSGWRRYRGPLRRHWEMLSDAEAVPQLNTVGESLSWKQGGKACSS